MTTTTVTLGGISEPIEPLGVTVEVAEVIGSWMPAPYLHARSLQLRTGGQDSVATLIEHAGQITPIRGHGSQPHYPSARPMQFVRLTVPFHDNPTPFVWVGIITHQTDTIAGAQGTTEYRDQTFVAHGLEWMLHREVVTRSRIDNGNTTPIWVERALPFNGGHGRGGRAAALHDQNMSPTSAGGTYHFAQNIGNARWNAWLILQYLERFWQPFNGWRWAIDATAEQFLDWFEPMNFEVHGQTLREIIASLVNRSRTLDHYWEWDNATGELMLYVQSHAIATLTLPGGDVLPAASQIISIDANTRQRSNIILARDYSSKVDQVIAEGDLITSTFAINVPSGSLVRDWSDADESAYSNACLAMPGYASLDKDAKAARNDLFRMAGSPRRAWTRYEVSAGWDGKANGKHVFPWVSTDGVTVDTTIGASINVPGLRLSLQTLIPKVNNAGEVTSLATEYESGLVFCRVPIIHRGVTQQVYCKIDDLGSLARSETAGNNGLGFSISARTYDSGPGLILETSVPAKVLALGVTTDADQPSDFKPVLDWQQIIAVVTAEADEHVRVAYPVSPAPTRGQVTRLHINLQGRARLDYLADGTPVGVDAAGQLYTADGTFLRDDRPFLRDVARMAWEWYQVDRQRLRFEVPYLLGDLIPADLIAVIDNENVNTLVTAISYDFTAGTTLIETGSAEEIDFSVLAAR